MRIKIFHILIGAGFIILGLGLFYLQVIRGGYYYNLSERNCIRIILEPAARGKILDRNGKILADSFLSFNVNFLPQELQDKSKAFMVVSQILGVPEHELMARYHKNYNLSFAPVEVAKNIPLEKAVILSEKNLDIPGVLINEEPRRRYPNNSLAAHILGYLAEIDRARLQALSPYGYKVKDIMGYAGIEGYLDFYLRGKEGGTQVQINNRGRMVRVLGVSSSYDGKDVSLTIDLEMQKVCDEALQNKRGAIVILDPFTGEILAMASSPNFDPNVFISGERDSINNILRGLRSPLLNRATSQSFPPGSIFKLVVATAALETGKISKYRTFFCSGSFSIGSAVFDCWSHHQTQDLNAAITHSCNVYFYNLGILIGPERLAEFAAKFGLGKPTGIEFFPETSGFVPTRLWKRLIRHEGWYDGDTVNFSIGQGYLVITPMQAVRMISVFANRGFLVSPYILKTIDNRQVAHRRPEKLSIKEQNLDIVRQGLKNVVADSTGTANIIAGLELNAAGKTGTAQVQNKLAHGWFIGFAPFDKPKIAFCVLLENVGSSAVSVLTMKNILQEFKEKGLL